VFEEAELLASRRGALAPYKRAVRIVTPQRFLTTESANDVQD
jgi:hypothetical protein